MKQEPKQEFDNSMLDEKLNNFANKHNLKQETLEEKYKRLYEFTRSILLATSSPKDFESNYEIILAEKTIKTFKN